jgi:tetrapyrrole methylase family protein/MazG family protein
MGNFEIDQNLSALDDLVRLVKILRGKHGCPWDQKQTPRNVGGYLIEEVFELVDAIEAEDPEHIREELGDVLFHIVFIARMFQERKEFDLTDVARSITEKMIRRHPHVFGDENVNTNEEILQNWHKIKLKEKKTTGKQSALDSIPVQMPALIRAYRILDRVADSGFDWPQADEAIENAERELTGLKTLLTAKNDSHLISQKFGDLLFMLVKLARLAEINPETALAGSNKKFEQRFRKMEEMVTESEGEFENLPSKEKALIWGKAKKIVR